MPQASADAVRPPSATAAAASGNSSNCGSSVTRLKRQVASASSVTCAPLQMQRRQAHRQRQRQDQMDRRLQRPGQCQHDTHRQPGQGHPGCQAPGGRQAHPGGLRVHIQRLRHAEGRQRGAELDDRFELVELPLLGWPERLAQPHGGQQQRDTATTLQQQGPRQLALERQGSRPKWSLKASANRLDASRRRPNGRTAAAAPNSARLARRAGQAPP